MSSKYLPKIIAKILKNNGIAASDIVDLCQIDLSYSCEYIKGYVVLTMKEIAIIKGGSIKDTSIKDRTIYLRGTQNIDMVEEDEPYDYGFMSYPFEDVSYLRIERMLATNVLYAEIGGTEQELVAFTNTFLESMIGFVRSFKKAKRDPSVQNDEADDDAKNEEEELYCPVCGTRYPDPDRKLCPKCMNKRSVFFRTLGYFMRYKVRFIALFLCYFAAAGVSLVWPYLSGSVLYDEVLNHTGEQAKYVVALGLLVLAMIVAKVAQQAISLLQMTFMAQVVAKTVRDMKKDVFSAMGKLSINFFVSRQTRHRRKVEGYNGTITSSHLRVNTSPSKLIAFFVNDFIVHVVGCAGQERKLVLHAELPLIEINNLKFQRLIDFLRIVTLRCPTPVGTHQAVDTEVTVVGRIAEITSVCPILLSRYTLGEQTLILEVPNELTCETRVLIVEVEHITHITHRVAHRVAVLALDVWTVMLILTYTLNRPMAGIHRRTHVGILATTLIVRETRLVECLDSIGHILEVITATRLITKRPHEDAHMVAHPLHMILGAFHHS